MYFTKCGEYILWSAGMPFSQVVRVDFMEVKIFIL